MSEKARIGLVAGETSGDLLGGHLIEAIRSRRPDCEFEGIAGPRMTGTGCRALYSTDRLAVNGYVEVIRHLPGLLKLRRDVANHFLARRPNVFVGIDAPDFNFGLEAKLKASGIPTVHFVSPSLWAWRGERIHQIGDAVSHMLVVFPLEREIYEKAGIPVTYVGHPLADMLPLEPDQASARQTLNLPERGEIVALLPGSRLGEVKRLLRPMLEMAQQLLKRRPGLHFVLPVAGESVSPFVQSHVRPGSLPITLTRGQASLAMTAADVVVLASGTATLEAALLKKPMVITYRLPALTYAIGKRKVYLPWVGLPNILLGRFAVPELIQDHATPEALARATEKWLDSPEDLARLQEDFLDLHRRLRCNATERIADALMPFLDNVP